MYPLYIYSISHSYIASTHFNKMFYSTTKNLFYFTAAAAKKNHQRGGGPNTVNNKNYFIYIYLFYFMIYLSNGKFFNIPSSAGYECFDDFLLFSIWKAEEAIDPFPFRYGLLSWNGPT